MITNVQAAPGPNGTTATITWDTDEPANSLVSYGTTPAWAGALRARRSCSRTRCRSPASLPSTLYYYRVTSADAAANSATYPITTDPPLFFTTPAAPPEACFTDDLAADFNLGSTGGTTYVTEAGDGGVLLAPTVGTEFSGTSLPADWSSSPWGGGGSATVGGGLLTVDGALASTTALYGARALARVRGHLRRRCPVPARRLR